MNNQTPIVYFAFANQKNNTLLALNAEIQGIKPYFKTCAVSKDVTFLMDENASKDQLKDSILAIKRGKTDEQPKIIHFSGHANKDFLLLSENNAVGAGSLLNLLRGIKNLKLVFMNACCTQALKDFLFNQPDIEVEAIIATSRKVNDETAAKFAESFYKSWLQEKVTLFQAFSEACEGVKGFQTVAAADGARITFTAANCREIVDDDGQEVTDLNDAFEWGLYWKEEKAKDTVLNGGFKGEISIGKQILLEQYEAALNEVNQKIQESRGTLEKNQNDLALAKTMPNDAPFRDITINALTQLDANLRKPIEELYDKSQAIWQQIINYDRGDELKKAIDEFNFSDELNRLPNLQNNFLPFGTYLLRGTANCALGLLTYRIANYGAAKFLYAKEIKRIDFSGVSESKNLVDKIKHELLPNNNDINAANFEDLAKSVAKTCLMQADPHPVMLILNNISLVHSPFINDILVLFWQTFTNEIAKIKDTPTLTRRIIILLIENTDDGDFNTGDEVEDPPTFCGLTLAQIQQNNHVFSMDKVAKLEKKAITDLYQAKNYLFPDWLKQPDGFWDEAMPYVGTILSKIAEKMEDDTLIKHIESRNKFEF